MGFARSLYARFRVLIHEAAKFGVVGAIGFVVSLGGADLLHFNLGVGKYTSVVIATVLATIVTFIGNRWWAFRHRERTSMGQETVLFFVFNGIGLLIQLAFVAIAHYGLGLTDTFSYNVANILGVIVATVFRLYTYRRWVFLTAEAEPSAAEQLQPETTGR